MTTTQKYYNKKKLMFEAFPKTDYNFFIEKQHIYPNSIERKSQYTGFKDLNEFLTYFNTCKPEEKIFCEMITSECNEFYDIEYENEQRNLYLNEEEFLDDFIDKRNKWALDEKKIDVQTISKFELYILSCTNTKKMSLHIIIRNNYHFKNIEDHKKFHKLFLDWLKINVPNTRIRMDASVYSPDRGMRTIGSHKLVSKENKEQYDYELNRKFKVLNIYKTYHTEKLQYFFITHINKYDEQYNFSKEDKKQEELKRIKFEEENTELFLSMPNTTDEEIKTLVLLISEAINNGTHSLCGLERKNKLGYKDYLTISFVIINHTKSEVLRKQIFEEWWNSLYCNEGSWEIDYDKLIHYKNQYNYNIGTLHFYAKENEKYKTIFTVKKNFIKDLFILQPSKYIDIIHIPEDVIYCQDIKFTEQKRCVCIKNGLGRGKTTSACKYIKDNKGLSVLWLSPRRTYARSITNEINGYLFGKNVYNIHYPNLKQKKQSELTEKQIKILNYIENNKFVCYIGDDDKPIKGYLKEVLKSGRLVLSMESLYKLNKISDTFHPDLIVGDEIEANLTQHTSPTNGIHMNENIQVLTSLLSDTRKKILLMDAFPTHKTTNFINNMNIPTTLYIYDRKADNRTMVELKDYEKLLSLLSDKLKQNEKNYFYVSSKNKAIEFYNQMTSLFPLKKFKLYTGNGENKTDLNNVKDVWMDIDCIFTTSTISVGINFDKKDVIHNIFIYASSASKNKVVDIIQSHYRIRHPINKTVYYTINPKIIGNSLETFYPKIIKSIDMKETDFMCLSNCYKQAPIQFKQLVIDNKYEYNLSIMYIKQVFNFYMNECGYTAEFTDYDIDIKYEKDEKKKDTTDFKDIHLLSEFEYKQLIENKGLSLSEDEKLMLDKKQLVVCVSIRGCSLIDENTMEKIWKIWRDFGKTKIRTLRNEKYIQENILTIEQLLNKNAIYNNIACIQGQTLIRLRFIIALCKSLKLKNSQDTETIITFDELKRVYYEAIAKEKSYEHYCQLLERNTKLKPEKDTGFFSLKDWIEIISTLFKSYGNTKLVRHKQKKKTGKDGKRVEASDYKLYCNIKPDINDEDDDELPTKIFDAIQLPYDINDYKTLGDEEKKTEIDIKNDEFRRENMFPNNNSDVEYLQKKIRSKHTTLLKITP